MIVGVTMVRDEADIIGYTLRHLLEDEGVDHLIVADNLSTDATRQILEGFPPKWVTILDDHEPGYDQSAKMTRLARRAHDIGAEWVLPFDADEYWYAPDSTIAACLAECPSDVVIASGWDHMPTNSDLASQCPFESMPYRKPTPQRLPKVAFRSHPQATVHVGNHDVDRPGERCEGLAYRHYQWRSLEQAKRKVRQGKSALEAAKLHFNYGTHWRTLGALNDLQLEAWFADLDTDDLVWDPAP